MCKHEPKKHNVKFIIFHFNLYVITKEYNIKIYIYISYIVSLSLSYEACLWASRVPILLPFLPSGAFCAALKIAPHNKKRATYLHVPVGTNTVGKHGVLRQLSWL